MFLEVRGGELEAHQMDGEFCPFKRAGGGVRAIK